MENTLIIAVLLVGPTLVAVLTILYFQGHSRKPRRRY